MTDILTEEEELEIEELLADNCLANLLAVWLAASRMLATIRDLRKRCENLESAIRDCSMNASNHHNEQRDRIATLESQLATAKAHLPLVFD